MKNIFYALITITLFSNNIHSQSLWGITLRNSSSTTNGGVFKANIDGTNATIIHAFTSYDNLGTGLTLANNGLIYGLFNGGLFSVNPETNDFEVVNTLGSYNGIYNIVNKDNELYFFAKDETTKRLMKYNYNTNIVYPLVYLTEVNSGLVLVNDSLLYMFGSTERGRIWEYNIHSNILQKRVEFNNNAQPLDPKIPFVYANGKLYATSDLGGVHGKGSLFEYIPGTDYVMVHYTFTGAMGEPYAWAPTGLCVSTNGNLYGTALQDQGDGLDRSVYYEYNLSTYEYETKKIWDTNKGYHVFSRPIEVEDSLFYGLSTTTSNQVILTQYNMKTNSYLIKSYIPGYINDYGQGELLLYNPNSTNVYEKTKSDEVFIYPNPTNDIINVKGNNIKRIDVYNSTGQLLKSCNTNMIDFSTLPSGIYFAKIYTNSDNHLFNIIKQ